MKRQITFSFNGTHYVLEEEGKIVFSIDGTELKFSSLDFYNGIYSENRSPAIDLTNTITSAEKKSQGGYIYTWLSDIISSIQSELGDCSLEEPDNTESNAEEPRRIIPLFDMAACAGNGFYLDSSIPSQDYSTDNTDATFAVRISGNSMEPTIPDESVVLVKQVEELVDDDIGIFVVDGTVMCKRFKVFESEIRLCPDNKSSEYKEYRITNDMAFVIQGKVIGIAT